MPPQPIASVASTSASQAPTNKLTPSLSKVQLMQNIDALQKGGMATSDVQSYVNNYSKGIDGNYTIKSTQAPASQTIPTQQAPQEENMGQLDADQVNQAGSKITSSITDAGTRIAQDANGTIGGETKAVGDTLEGLGGAAAGAIQGVFAPVTASIQKLQMAASDNKGVQSVAQSKPVSDTLDSINSHISKVGDWLNKNLTPRQQEDLTNALTVGTTVAGGEGGLIPGGEMSVSDAANTLKGVGSDAATAVKTGAQVVKTGAQSVKDTVAANTAKETASQSAKTEAKNLQTSIQHTMPLTNKDVRTSDLENTYPNSAPGKGGVAREGVLGTSAPQPTTADIQRGTTAHEYINGVKDPVQRIAQVNQGIRDTSNETDSFLDHNSSPTNFADMRDYVEANNTPSASLKEDPAAYSAYQRTSENALDTLYKTMKATAKETGDFGAVTPGSDIRAARIAVDQQIKAELRGATLGSPQYNGIKAAAVSARNVLNRMSEDMLRYPGQMEALNKYNADLATLQERGIEATTEAKQAIADKYGLKSTPESEANAAKLAAQHQKMSDLYDARDNMIDKYQSNVGKNNWQEFMKNNPVIRKALRYGLIGAGAYTLGHEI